jgi:general secretion pathway protein L
LTAAATLLLTSSWVLNEHVLQQQQQLAQKLAHARAEKSKSDQTGITLEQSLWRKKYQIAPTVLVLEHLSQTLPDTTYLTSLQIDANKVRLSGSSRNAPSLIELLERSQHFSRATFYAPTTRASSGVTERFQIEALTQPPAPQKPL